MKAHIFEIEVLLSNGQERVFEVLAASEDDAIAQAWEQLDYWGPVEINPEVERRVAS
jgi:hypothetical protein